MFNRPCVIIGNWKMHKTIEEALEFVQQLIALYEPREDLQVGLAVPYTQIYPLSKEIDHPLFMIGAQNMNDASEGAFTGEIAGMMLKEAGAQFVLLGHSERRHLYAENDAFIHRKLKKAVEVGLQPILCVGETLDEYERNETAAVIEKQLTEGLKEFQEEELTNLIIAYEPVWAIGNGESATPQIVQEVHVLIREFLSNRVSEDFAKRVVIQYGGSVNPLNAHSLLAQPDIDGLLIGGASLSLESFLQIVNDRYSKIQLE
ncbi:MAG: triose-phosphate isomerase [Parachlamydiaceae bacterium]